MKNKEIIFEFLQTSEEETEGYTASFLAEKLQMQRSNVSALLNELVKENRVEKSKGRPVKFRLPHMPKKDVSEESCFKELIGHDSSLKNSVQLSKAAILYPNQSLPTLIEGAVGVGKSFFVNLMDKFAKERQVISQDAPVVVFKSGYYDYEEAADELLKEGGVFQQALNGMLYIEQIDLLPPNKIDELFSKFEKLSQTEQTLILVGSSNEKLSPRMEKILSSKFSVKVELPVLKNRTLLERFNLIQHFFIEESEKMGRTIKINAELFRCILLYPCEENVKELQADIKLGCANAYVREFNMQTDTINIYTHDFPHQVRKGFLFYKDYRDQIEELIPENYSYSFSSQNMKRVKASRFAENEGNIYKAINYRVEELKEHGISKEDISAIVNVDLEHKIHHLSKKVEKKVLDKESLTKVVDEKVIYLVEGFLDELTQNFGVVYENTVYYSLCLHINDLLHKKVPEVKLSNNQIIQIVEKDKQEYMQCTQFSAIIEKEFGRKLTIDEIVFLTMFITDKKEHEKQRKPVVLVAMHGNSAASSVAESVNTLLKADNIFSYDLNLDQNLEESYEELKNHIQQIDQGKGIVFIYDMGSLKQMADFISQETGIAIKTIEVPLTLIALETSRKAIMFDNAEEVQENVVDSFLDAYSITKDVYQRNVNKKIIVTLCTTGKGGALSIKQYLEKNMELPNIDIVPLAIGDRNALIYQLNQLKKQHDILCVIGTYDPQLFGLTFISISKLFEIPKDKLSMLLTLEEIQPPNIVDYDAILAYLSEQMPLLDTELVKKTLLPFIQKVSQRIVKLTNDQELGLFVHIACVIYRLQENEQLPDNLYKDRIIQRNKRMYYQIKDLLEPLEEAFSITFEDRELVNILSIIKQE